MSLTEWLGAITGLLCVFLTVRANIWNWPIGILNNIFFLVLFFESGLYADAILQIIFAGISFYGWWQWRFGGAKGGERPVGRISNWELGWVGLATQGGTLLFAALLSRYTPSTVAYMDAWTTALSLSATYLQSRKYLESWVLWILVDVFYIGLYLYKGLQLTAGVYFVFLCMCFMGWRSWKRLMVST